MHFHVGEDDRVARLVDHGRRLGQGGAEGARVAAVLERPGFVVGDARHVHHVPRQFKVHRAFEPQRGMEHPVNFLEGRLGIAQHGRGHGELLEDFLLGVELARLVVQQRISGPFLHARHTADDDDRRFLGEGLGRGVGHFQAADAVGDAHRPQAAGAGVSVRGKPGALFVAGVDDAQLRATFQQAVEG